MLGGERPWGVGRRIPPGLFQTGAGQEHPHSHCDQCRRWSYMRATVRRRRQVLGGERLRGAGQRHPPPIRQSCAGQGDSRRDRGDRQLRLLVCAAVRRDGQVLGGERQRPVGRRYSSSQPQGGAGEGRARCDRDQCSRRSYVRGSVRQDGQVLGVQHVRSVGQRHQRGVRRRHSDGGAAGPGEDHPRRHVDQRRRPTHLRAGIPGKVVCWGGNAFGQLGQTPLRWSGMPVVIEGP